MKLSQHRILTTHVGSLPRSEEVFKLVFAKEAGEKIDMNHYDQVIADAVQTVVRKQTEVGVVHVDFFACLLGKYEFKDLFRTGEAADMGGKDSVLTQFHRYRLIWGKC